MTDSVARELITVIREMVETEKEVLRHIRDRDEDYKRISIEQYEEGKAYRIARDKLLDDRSENKVQNELFFRVLSDYIDLVSSESTSR